MDGPKAQNLILLELGLFEDAMKIKIFSVILLILFATAVQLCIFSWSFFSDFIAFDDRRQINSCDFHSTVN